MRLMKESSSFGDFKDDIERKLAIIEQAKHRLKHSKKFTKRLSTEYM